MRKYCMRREDCPFAITDKAWATWERAREKIEPLSWDDLQTMFGKYVVVTYPNSELSHPQIKRVYELSITESGKFVHFNDDVEDFVAVEHENPKLWKLCKIYPLDVDLEKYKDMV